MYRPHCERCTACVPVRVRTDQHHANRNQRRTLRKNQDLRVSIHPAIYRDEYFDLFSRYLHARHAKSEMTATKPAQFSEFLISQWCQTEFLEVRLGKQLLAIAVTDRCQNGLSAVYTFFDPAHASRNLGRFCVLQQIELAARRKLPYLYLGYWIEACGNMAYKTEYKPLEMFSNNAWVLKAEDE